MGVGEEGLEPSRVLPHRNLNPAASANSATRPDGGEWYQGLDLAVLEDC